MSQTKNDGSYLSGIHLQKILEEGHETSEDIVDSAHSAIAGIEKEPFGTGQALSSEPITEKSESLHSSNSYKEKEMQDAVRIEDGLVSTQSLSTETLKNSSSNNDSASSVPSSAPQSIINRFSSWRQQAVKTLQQTATTRSASETFTKRAPSWTGATLVPLESASLSPISPNKTTDIATMKEIVYPESSSDQVELPVAGNPSTIDDKSVVPSSDSDPWADLPEIQNFPKTSKTYSVIASSFASTTVLPQMDAISRAAANVVDSVQSSYFKGRYASSVSSRSTDSIEYDDDYESTTGGLTHNSSRRPRSNSTSSSVTNNTSTTNQSTSQTARILSGPSAVHIQDFVQSLQPNEVFMLLGKGRLGVNLKQSYKKNTGVYVDFLVEGGAAHVAAVACVGDTLKQIGNQSQLQGTILTVPQHIAKANRPVHLIFRSGATDPCNFARINFIDVAIALMHELFQQTNDMEQLTESSTGVDELFEGEFPSINYFDSLDSITFPISPSLSTQRRFATSSAKRNMIGGIGYTPKNDPTNESNDASIVKEFCQLVATHSQSLGMSLKLAFILCCVDCRRVPFLRSHLSGNSVATVVKDAHSKPAYLGFSQGKSNEARGTGASGSESRQHSKNFMMLEFFLETVDFTDFFELMTPTRRLDTALRISHKYFLPSSTIIENGLQTLIPPPMDLHSTLVSDSVLRKLEQTLCASTTTDNNTSVIHRDMFWEFQRSCLEQLANGTAFTSFLISPECSRMRAYLRNVAPFINVPLHQVIRQMRSSEDMTTYAMNYIQYCVLFLLCLTDTDVYGENDEILEQNKMAMVSQNTAPSPNKVYNSYNSTDSTNSGGKPSQMVKSTRIEDAPYGLCAAIFIQSKLLPAAIKANEVLGDDAPKNDENETTDTVILKRFLVLIEQFWEVFVAPNIGSLAAAAASSSNEEDILEKIDHCRSVLQHASRKVAQNCTKLEQKENMSSYNQLVETSKQFLHNSVISVCQELADELFYDYAVNFHTKFRMHKFHEWMCEEFLITKQYESTRSDIPVTSCRLSTEMESKVPRLPNGCIKRLLRKADFPVGISQHKPSIECALTEDQTVRDSKHLTGNDHNSTLLVNAECAIIFGSSCDIQSHELRCPGLIEVYANVKRYCCHSVAIIDSDENRETSLNNYMKPQEVPQTLESYAITAPARTKPFDEYMTSDFFHTIDGWTVSLMDFLIPQVDTSSGTSTLYGVSLTFQKNQRDFSSPANDSISMHSPNFKKQCSYDLNYGSAEEERVEELDASNSFTSPTSRQCPQVTRDCPLFNERLLAYNGDKHFEGLVSQTGVVIVGVALVSKRNSIFAMRNTLSLLLNDYSKHSDSCSRSSGISCSTLISLLGSFDCSTIEPCALKCILERYLRSTASPWLQKPIFAQHELFIQHSGMLLIRSLPPIPLALLFVAALLEQKIVISSSRRSLLISATTALSELLKPLKWCHVIVPQVPSTLAADLLQYPGPSILGMCSEDYGILDLLRDLHQDVTLVDLDVGRVILASSLAHDRELGRGTPNNSETARILRSQVLYLAQSLGSVFGRITFPQEWNCDKPETCRKVWGTEEVRTRSSLNLCQQFEDLRMVCRDFIEELLAGTNSCCYWIEEAVADYHNETNTVRDSTVLFDEDRFFHIKNFRERDGGFDHLIMKVDKQSIDRLHSLQSCKLALSLDQFDLVLELFLRCQCMNDYIGTRQREEMVFSP